MTVAELIDVLSKMPQDAIVKVLTLYDTWEPASKAEHDEDDNVVFIEGE